MYNRAEIVDKNFTHFVKEGLLPQARTHVSWNPGDLSGESLVDLFESQVISRHLDLQARLLKEKGHSFYTIGSSGHEGNAIFGKVFRKTDMAFLHYRSGAFMVQRSKQLPGSTPLYDTLLSLMASTEDPIAGGRHKVFGSKPLLVPPQTSTIASHLPKAVGAALSIPRAKDLGTTAIMPEDSIVTCSFGDASFNHSTAQGAINTASLVSYQHVKLPLVFICEDNHIGISVPTSEGWVKNSLTSRPKIKYLHCDGLHLVDVYKKTIEADFWARHRKQPVFLHMETLRLLGHAGSDVESTYRKLTEIEETEKNDPLLHSARILLENQILTQEEILKLYEGMRERVSAIANETKDTPRLTDPKDVKSTITSCVDKKNAPKAPSEEKREQIFGRDYKRLSSPQHMAKLLNWGLTDILLQYPNALVFGEDVAKKGGVYHVTDDLYKRFGVKRVFNSPLDEQSIIGTGIGLAHNGFLPIPEIQFLAYVHNAEDQIRGEAATLAFFSKGQFTNPMVLRVAGLAYQKGFGGHFHNDNSLAVFRDIPGLVIAVPSNGEDAVKMLRACTREAYENGRVVVFIEPIALYMTKDLHEVGDKLWSFPYPELEEEISLGQIGVNGEGRDLTIITYGNGVYYSKQAIKELEDKFQFSVKLIDLRWIAPIDFKKLTQEISLGSKVLIVDECRKTGSLSEALVTGLVECCESFPKTKVVAAEDCFIPLGPGAASGLPKKAEILKACYELLEVTQ